MPLDQFGKRVAVGDTVTLKGKVAKVDDSNEYVNCTVELEQPMPPAGAKTKIQLNTKQLENKTPGSGGASGQLAQSIASQEQARQQQQQSRQPPPPQQQQAQPQPHPAQVHPTQPPQPRTQTPPRPPQPPRAVQPPVRPPQPPPPHQGVVRK